MNESEWIKFEVIRFVKKISPDVIIIHNSYILFPREIIGDNTYVNLYFDKDSKKVAFDFNKNEDGYKISFRNNCSPRLININVTKKLSKFIGHHKYEISENKFVVKESKDDN
jgi:hypothetical protein